MKDKYAKVSLIVSIALLILSGFFMSVRGDDVVFFVLAAIFAIPSIAFGKRVHQYCGTIVLIVASSAALIEYRAGRAIQEAMQQKYEMIEHTQEQREDASP